MSPKNTINIKNQEISIVERNIAEYSIICIGNSNDTIEKDDYQKAEDKYYDRINKNIYNIVILKKNNTNQEILRWTRPPIQEARLYVCCWVEQGARHHLCGETVRPVQDIAYDDDMNDIGMKVSYCCQSCYDEWI
jgi:hypothetical protein